MDVRLTVVIISQYIQHTNIKSLHCTPETNLINQLLFNLKVFFTQTENNSIEIPFFTYQKFDNHVVEL